VVWSAAPQLDEVDVRIRLDGEQETPSGEFEREITEDDMKKSFVGLVVLMCLGWFMAITLSNAQVSIDVHIGPPPRYAIPSPPQVIAIPGTYVYMIPSIAVDILFYQNYWYRPHEDHWFRSKSYNGPWQYQRQVPRALMQLPSDYRTYREPPPGYRRVPYGQAKKNWKKWEQSKYWEHDEHWREGSRSRQYDGPGPQQDEKQGHGHKDQGHGHEKGQD